ncbi:hypothetical protein XPN_0187, partial [Xanthomonas arboricola pv. pruni MAFF 301427]
GGEHGIHYIAPASSIELTANVVRGTDEI